jgi:uncharacterized protein YebE (UPF0316 family)
MVDELKDFDYFNWVLLPLLIFVARMFDVTLATLRNIFISKGFRHIVPFIGFVEVLIWLVAITQTMKNLNNVACYLAWAGGFSMGTYVGMRIEEKIALGLQVIRIITNQDCEDLIEALREANHGVTVVPAEGAKGPVKMIFTIMKRKNVAPVVELIRYHNPTAFYSVEDIRHSSQGVFMPGSRKMAFVDSVFSWRKGK